MASIGARLSAISVLQSLRFGYHAVMEILRSPGKEVVKFVTPSGVQAIVDTSIPRAAIAGFIRKLEAKQAKRAEKLAIAAAAGKTK